MATTQWPLSNWSSFIPALSSLIEKVLIVVENIKSSIFVNCLLPYRISFGSVARPQCYDFINQIKYIIRPRRSDINLTKYITHMPPMIWRDARLMFILVTATTNRSRCRWTRSIWNAIINNFDTHIHYTASQCSISISTKFWPFCHWASLSSSVSFLSSSVWNKSDVVSKCFEFFDQLLYQQHTLKFKTQGNTFFKVQSQGRAKVCSYQIFYQHFDNLNMRHQGDLWKKYFHSALSSLPFPV